MSRLKELQDKYKDAMKHGSPSSDPDMWAHLLLSDIAKSLAVIADALSTEEPYKEGFEDGYAEGYDDGKRANIQR